MRKLPSTTGRGQSNLPSIFCTRIFGIGVILPAEKPPFSRFRREVPMRSPARFTLLLLLVITVTICASAAGPVFQGGRLYGQYQQSKADLQEAKLQYQQAVLGAFHDVVNALVSRQKLEAVRVQQSRAVAAYQEAVTVSTQRYIAGKASYYDVEVNGKTNKDAAWYYPTPLPAAQNIAGYVAFWKGVQIET